MLGMNAPIGHPVQMIQTAPASHETSTDKIAAAIEGIRAEAPCGRLTNGRDRPRRGKQILLEVLRKT